MIQNWTSLRPRSGSVLSEIPESVKGHQRILVQIKINGLLSGNSQRGRNISSVYSRGIGHASSFSKTVWKQLGCCCWDKTWLLSSFCTSWFPLAANCNNMQGGKEYEAQCIYLLCSPDVARSVHKDPDFIARRPPHHWKWKLMYFSLKVYFSPLSTQISTCMKLFWQKPFLWVQTHFLCLAECQNDDLRNVTSTNTLALPSHCFLFCHW